MHTFIVVTFSSHVSSRVILNSWQQYKVLLNTLTRYKLRSYPSPVSVSTAIAECTFLAITLKYEHRLHEKSNFADSLPRKKISYRIILLLLCDTTVTINTLAFIYLLLQNLSILLHLIFIQQTFTRSVSTSMSEQTISRMFTGKIVKVLLRK